VKYAATEADQKESAHCALEVAACSLRCHLRVTPVASPGKLTVTEYVCLTSGSGVVGEPLPDGRLLSERVKCWSLRCYIHNIKPNEVLLTARSWPIVSTDRLHRRGHPGLSLGKTRIPEQIANVRNPNAGQGAREREKSHARPDHEKQK
jgi:hypothetical protein